jgi:hypothetical protein
MWTGICRRREQARALWAKGAVNRRRGGAVFPIWCCVWWWSHNLWYVARRMLPGSRPSIFPGAVCRVVLPGRSSVWRIGASRRRRHASILRHLISGRRLWSLGIRRTPARTAWFALANWNIGCARSRRSRLHHHTGWPPRDSRRHRLAPQDAQPVIDLLIVVRRYREELEPLIPIVSAAYHDDERTIVFAQPGRNVLPGHGWKQQI